MSTPPSSLIYHLVEPLTTREVEILTLFSEGLSNREVADQLIIADTTIKWYNQRIYDKFSLEKPYRKRQWVIHCARELNILPALDEDPSQPLPGDNPYKGLDTFQQEDASLFFGRETLVDQLVTHLSENGSVPRFLAVVGPSGSGKSSVVRAGLIPALHEDKLPGAATWAIATMFPRVNPFYELETTLQTIAVKQQSDLLDLLQRDAYGLVRCVPLVLPKEQPLLLIIDQFEEIFTLVEDAGLARRFMDLIYAAVTDPRSTVRVVITLRADFLDRPLMYPDFSWLVQTRTAMVVPMVPDELERAITLPAEKAHVSIEPGVVARLVVEANEQPGALPLLEFALTELYDTRIGRTITMNTYEEIGGVRQALAAQADRIFTALDADQQEAARQLFLRLITLGEGTEDVRRRVPTRELASLAVPTETIGHLTQFLAANRLLTLDIDPATKEPSVEVAHEALIREWSRLRTWLDEDRHDIRQQRLLAAAAAEWRNADRDHSYLLRGSRLKQFEGWAADTDLALTGEERDYLALSSAEEERQQTRQRRVRYLAFAVITVVAIMLAVLALWANSQRNRAEDEKAHAETAEQEALRQASIGLAASALRELEDGEQDRAVLLALEALEHYPYTSQAESALADAIEAYVPNTGKNFNNHPILTNLDNPDGFRFNVNMPLAFFWSPDGTRLATMQRTISSEGSDVDMVFVTDVGLTSLMFRLSLNESGCAVHDIDWAPGGERLASIYTEGLS